ncbi:MAG: homoserine O-acetyltransferase MetA [Acutalibacteraceae bacterium]|jgi:homoserine O-succinyltransferase
MPIKIPDKLPAQAILEAENIFIMSEERAVTQDIRPLRILLLNLMPTKVETETQLLRILGNTPLQVEIQLLQTATHVAKNISAAHLTSFYYTLDQVRDQKFDGMIVTGAPVELMEFEEVDYWDELCEIFEWSRTNVYSSLFICWGAQAALHYFYGIQKHLLPEKLVGVFPHHTANVYHPLMRGLDDIFLMPHSRHTTVLREDIDNTESLVILANSRLAGVSVIASKSGRRFFLSGHPEYDRMTLANEYYRDVNKGLNPKVPYHYFPENNPALSPELSWRSTATILFANWLNYYVYQQTPYDLHDLEQRTLQEGRFPLHK